LVKFANAQAIDDRFNVRVSSTYYSPTESIIVYGRSVLGDSIIVRLFDASGIVVRLETIPVEEDGTFIKQVFVWPQQPSKQYPFGAYLLEVRSSIITSDLRTFPIYFDAAGRSGGISSDTASPPSNLVVKLDSPTQVSTGSPFRIFVQVTQGGALVNVNTDEELVAMLGSSHIHSGNPEDSTVINLSGRFSKLHEGLYYADVTLDRDGSYIIHAIAFNNGFLSHDSRVIVASSSSIGTVQESVNRLNERLDATNAYLDKTNASLNSTSITLTESLSEAGKAIQQMRDASGQINSIILPILALISVIIALQISLFARIRASYR